MYAAATGEQFAVRKELRGGRELTLFERRGSVLDREQMRRYEASGAVPVVEPALAAAAARAEPGERLDVIVWLRDRRGPAAARRIRAERMPAIDALGERARAIRRTARPGTSLAPDEELRFVASASAGALSGSQRAELRDLAAEVEAASGRMREEIRREVAALVEPALTRLEAVFETLGGRVGGRIASQAALTGSLPAARLEELAARPEVARIGAVPEGYLELDNQCISLGLPAGFWWNGIDGGIWDVGILDSGVQQNHPNLDHVTYYTAPGMPATDSAGHGTGVAGIIYNDHATIRGMAPGLDAALVGSCSDAGSPDTVLVHADWMVATALDDPEAINLSCGYGIANIFDYDAFDQFWDGLIDDNSLLVGKSAGNGGDGTTRITHPAPAYNLLAVANVWDQDTTGRGDDVIRSTSSRGPTLAGRKKPDIAAPGHRTMTTNNLWSGPAADFVNLGGTSAAAPKVTGGVVLLTNLRGSDQPTANKAVLLNTADAWTDNGTSGDASDDGEVAGSEWNKTYGWGYLDLYEAWFNGLDVFTDTVDDGYTPPGPDFKLYKGFMYADEKATLVWNRHVGYAGTALPTLVEALTDLDLFAYRADDGSWADSSTTAGDNVEQVAVPTSADYVLKVDVYGNIDPDVGVESFALATEENFVIATTPTFVFATPPLLAPPGNFVRWDVMVVNLGTVTAFTNLAEIFPASGFTVDGGSNPQAIGDIPAGENKTARWRLRAPCSTGQFLHQVANSSSSYGESLSSSQSLPMVLGTTTLADDIPVTSNQIENTFDFEVVDFDWTAVAIDPGAVNRNLFADDGLCIDSAYESSSLSGTVRDFIVADGRDYGNATHYAMVTRGTSGLEYSIEADRADDVHPGSFLTSGFAAGEVVEMFESLLVAGESYRIGVDMVSGDTDVSLFVYEASRSDGGRDSSSYFANNFGDGASEARTFTSAESGLFGTAVVNDNATTGSFTFTVDHFWPATCHGEPAELRNEVIEDTLVLVDCDPFELGPDLTVAGDLTVRSGSAIGIGNGVTVTGTFTAEIDPTLGP